MPSVTLSTSKPTTASADVLILGIRGDEDKGDLAETLDLLGFSGEKGQSVRFPSGGLVKAPVVVALALPDEPTDEDLRRAAARGIRAAKNATTVAIALHPAGVDEVEAIAEGIDLGAYRFDTYKTRNAAKDAAPVEIASAVILTPFARQTTATKAVERASTVALAVNTARDWVNTPPGDKRPADLVEAITTHVTAAAGTAVKVSVWDEKRLAKERCGGILGVGQGSDSPPRLVTLSYEPDNAVAHLALVGKGITFDSGGLSIKPGASMQTMKLDMAGAAAVVAATVAIATLGLPVRITAYACLAENMPSGRATRPGDVLHMRSGATVEVHNTDAEGRLVLADGLALAAEAQPDHIVDVATLTGACIVALGSHTSGILGNDDDFSETVLAASAAAGESMWRLPITEEMKGIVTSSTVADLRQHNPKPYGGALFAAAFLREFVGDVPWAHLDIAGPSFNEGSAVDYTPVGGTGTGVRTLVRLATELAGSR
ncbi:leucyl aminopeptidase [Aeromicrobium sp. CFBP 8757]|uniref:leucyl aminopeptidase n=1 Tax=Aeromicrobium sp. CFBP 8757 TaxID=2775288 RepID=UPI0017806C2F|nr:leucyl aminopeptidase [Aeromicrobium sp. CFBP 8757]MBD8608156.1 leucyl aminopeptidase [Aeromicrobium sp. CFBP 8757]